MGSDAEISTWMSLTNAFRTGDQIGRRIGRTADRPDDAAGTEEYQHVGPDFIGLGIDGEHRRPAHHDHRREPVERHGNLRRGIAQIIDGRNGQIVRQKNRILHLLLQPGDGHLAQVVGLHHKNVTRVRRNKLLTLPADSPSWIHVELTLRELRPEIHPGDRRASSSDEKRFPERESPEESTFPDFRSIMIRKFPEIS